MDLLSKAIVASAAIVIIIFAGYFTLSHVSFGQQISSTQASSLVLHDLQNANPGSAVNITNVTPSQYAGSWHILASVVANATSPCPSYYIYSFDYPKYGFVYRVENTYTEGCVVYGDTLANGRSIGSYPVAITDSYSLNLTSVNGFVSRHGFGNVVVHASYYPLLNLSGRAYTKVWLVNYTAQNPASYLDVVISQTNGTALSTYGSS